jgi:hypothetical protein
LTVSPTGDVTDASIDSSQNPDPAAVKFWPCARSEILKWKFAPFERDGHAATVQIEEYVGLVPPMRVPTGHVPAPAITPDSKIEISLARSGCYGPCPAYTVTLGSDGSVVFDGRFYTATQGTQTAHIDPAAVRRLAQKFVDVDFYSMDDKYVAAVTDNPSYVLNINIDGHSKQVCDYVGEWVGMPEIITDLEDEVDDVAHTDRWIGHPRR